MIEQPDCRRYLLKAQGTNKDFSVSWVLVIKKERGRKKEKYRRRKKEE
jgi:hypothetical protein